ncbi:MAG: hypothetical protein AB1705_02230 [Verrucomicrobiota bacterium]
MITIYKYKVKQQEYQTIELPVGARVLTAQALDVNVWIWAQVDTEVKEREPRKFVVLKTGQEINYNPELLWHIESVQFGGGELVLHVFEYTGPDLAT